MSKRLVFTRRQIVGILVLWACTLVGSVVIAVLLLGGGADG